MSPNAEKPTSNSIRLEDSEVPNHAKNFSNLKRAKVESQKNLLSTMKITLSSHSLQIYEIFSRSLMIWLLIISV